MARDDPRHRLIGPNGRFVSDPALAGRRSPLDRFRDKCEFDPSTGCVLWTGGTTQGRGNTAVYGSFWADRRRWFAHRWAALHIHGLDIDGLTVGHCCPGTPNTLCVQHLRGETIQEGNAEKWARYHANQTPEEKQHWLFVSLGIHDPEPASPPDDVPGVPFYTPPDWLGLNVQPIGVDDCPF